MSRTREHGWLAVLVFGISGLASGALSAGEISEPPVLTLSGQLTQNTSRTKAIELGYAGNANGMEVGPWKLIPLNEFSVAYEEEAVGNTRYIERSAGFALFTARRSIHEGVTASLAITLGYKNSETTLPASLATTTEG